MAQIIKQDDRSPSEILMESLSEVEGKKRIVILMESDDGLTIKTNCTFLRDLKWILDQAAYCTMKDLFTVERD